MVHRVLIVPRGALHERHVTATDVVECQTGLDLATDDIVVHDYKLTWGMKEGVNPVTQCTKYFDSSHPETCFRSGLPNLLCAHTLPV